MLQQFCSGNSGNCTICTKSHQTGSDGSPDHTFLQLLRYTKTTGILRNRFTR